MDFDVENFNEQEIAKVNELINSIKKEKNSKKWWIVPNFDFFYEQYNPSIGHNYFIEEQKDFYSKNRPPLKYNFNSHEEAEKWLKNYQEELTFKKAYNELSYFINKLSSIAENLKHHQRISGNELHEIFSEFYNYKNQGNLSKVIEG